MKFYYLCPLSVSQMLANTHTHNVQITVFFSFPFHLLVHPSHHRLPWSSLFVHWLSALSLRHLYHWFEQYWHALRVLFSSVLVIVEDKRILSGKRHTDAFINIHKEYNRRWWVIECEGLFKLILFAYFRFGLCIWSVHNFSLLCTVRFVWAWATRKSKIK